MRRLSKVDSMGSLANDSLALKRMGTKDEIADAALWLCSDAASYVTGTIIEVEGGTNLGDASFAKPLKE